MKINLLPIMNADGKRLELDCELDFSEKTPEGVTFLSLVKVCGECVSLGGTVDLSVSVSVRVAYVCDRCCEPFEDTLSFSVKEVLKKEDQKDESDINPDIIYFEGNGVELDDIISENIFLNLPTKHICDEDCRGLCPNCGANLNFGECCCDTRPTDPRFDILDKFFE